MPALDTPVEGAAVAPLHLKWDAKTQKRAATVVRRGVRETFGYYATVADADAIYRTIVQLHDAGRATKVHSPVKSTSAPSLKGASCPRSKQVRRGPDAAAQFNKSLAGNNKTAPRAARSQ